MPPKGEWVGNVAFALRTFVFGPPPALLGGKPPSFVNVERHSYTHTTFYLFSRSFIAPKAGGVIIPPSEKSSVSPLMSDL